MIFEMRTYDQGYHERVETRAGTPLFLRMVKPTDKEKFVADDEVLSDEFHYERSFSHNNGLTADELIFFTKTDGFDHFAIGAIECSANGDEGRGVAIVRFIRDIGDPKLAEVFITVIDEMQGQGIGHLLLERVVEAARERDVNRFRFQVLGNDGKTNAPIDYLWSSTTFTRDGNLITAETSLEKPAGRGIEELFDILRLVASRKVLTPPDLGWRRSAAAL